MTKSGSRVLVSVGAIGAATPINFVQKVMYPSIIRPDLLSDFFAWFFLLMAKPCTCQLKYHTGNLDWIIPSENQALRACSSFRGILGNKKPFYLQIDCLYKLFKLGLIGVLKCALFAFFHSKCTILMVKNCQNFVIFPTFQSQNDFKINEGLETC